MSDNMKAKKLNNFIRKQQSKNQNDDRLIQIFNQDMIGFILNHIDNSFPAVEKQLINVVDIVFDLVEELNDDFYFYNPFPFYDNITKIKQLIQQKIENEDRNNQNSPYSDQLKQIASIYIKLNKQKLYKESQISDEVKEKASKLFKNYEKVKKEDEMMITCYKIFDKNQTSIFGLTNLTDKEKEEKARILYNKMKKKDLKQLKKIFNFNTIIDIQKQLGNCTTTFQIVVLDIIELLIQQGDSQNGNKFFSNMRGSGLISRIETLIKDKVEQKERENIDGYYSELDLKLVHIYNEIMLHNFMKKGINDFCVKIFDRNISIILSKFKNYRQENDLNSEIQNKSEITEEEIKYVTSTLELAGNFEMGMSHYTHGSIQRDLLFREKIILLLHINCSSENNCSNCIIVQPTSHTIQELQAAVFNSVSVFTYWNKEFSESLIKDHQILNHIYQIISTLQSSSLSIPSQSFISSVLNLLYGLLNPHHKNINTIISFPNLVPTIVKLLLFKVGFHDQLNENQNGVNIRKQSQKCLELIRIHGDIEAQIILSHSYYIRSLTILISQAGGIGDQNDYNIREIALITNNFLTDLRKGRKEIQGYYIYPQYTFPPNRDIYKELKEQYEEQGGVEELESHFFHLLEADSDSNHQNI